MHEISMMEILYGLNLLNKKLEGFFFREVFFSLESVIKSAALYILKHHHYVLTLFETAVESNYVGVDKSRMAPDFPFYTIKFSLRLKVLGIHLELILLYYFKSEELLRLDVASQLHFSE